jgi:hypothetical protein
MTVIVFYLLARGFFGFQLYDGAGLDPHGGRQTLSQGDDGRGIDPNGRGYSCPRLATHEGNGLDPHGQPKP